jgi:SAM-dependent methyltransferase
MNLDLHYVDPRLVALYDNANPRGADTDFYLQLADELAAHTILDLGCGTGQLTRALATGDRRVIGIDPAPAMLAVARSGPRAERVQWIAGDSGALGTPGADLVLMTGNVAQVFLGEAAWLATLRDSYAALRPGGYLAFESRNPAAQAWAEWTPDATHTVTDSPFGPIEEWLDVVGVENGCIHLQGYNRFQVTGELLVVDSTLRFRQLHELETSLTTAGFTIEQIYGDWHRGPFTSASSVIVIVARHP